MPLDTLVPAGPLVREAGCLTCSDFCIGQVSLQLALQGHHAVTIGLWPLKNCTAESWKMDWDMRAIVCACLLVILNARQEVHSATSPRLLRTVDLAYHLSSSCLTALYAEVEASPLTPTSSVRSLKECLSRLSPTTSSSYFASLKACYASRLDSYRTLNSSSTICFVSHECSTLSGHSLEALFYILLDSISILLIQILYLYYILNFYSKYLYHICLCLKFYNLHVNKLWMTKTKVISST